VCTVCIEAFRLLTLYLKPVLPALAVKVEAFLKISPLDWADAAQPLGAGHAIGEYKHLMQRADAKVVDTLFEAPEPVAAAAPVEAAADALPGGEAIAPTITIDDFVKIDLRIAKIVACEKVEGSTKLLRLTLDAGEGKTRRGVLFCATFQRHRLGLPARAAGGQAHGAGREPRAAQDEVRHQRRHGAGREPRRRESQPGHPRARTRPGATPGMRVR
jgi:methionyl-tRNA synthetase